MKQVPKYYTANRESVEAYQPKDIEKLKPILEQAEQIWLDEWKRQGCKDEGTCCLGKGIQVWFVGKRKRTADLSTVIKSPPCQGNVSAYRSVGPALTFLEEQGVKNARYYDGRMD